jgi:hypothetical protein
MVIFTPTGQIINDNWPEIRKRNFNWGTSALRMRFSYAQGYITTALRNNVVAYQLVSGSLVIELYDKKTGIIIPKPPKYFNRFEYDLSYNCFGYCFAESKVWLLDPSQFITDEYVETDSDNAELIVFKEHKSIGDAGEDLYTFSHAVKVLDNKNVSFKPGLNALIENVPAGEAIHTYNYNSELYLRKKDAD